MLDARAWGHTGGHGRHAGGGCQEGRRHTDLPIRTPQKALAPHHVVHALLTQTFIVLCGAHLVCEHQVNIIGTMHSLHGQTSLYVVG